MNKEDWIKVKNALTDLFSGVYLNIDGYEVVLRLVRISTYKNSIAIYINGVFKGKWLVDDCEERRRFVQKKQKSLLTKKDKEGWKKLSKKAQKEFVDKYDIKYDYYSSHWSSLTALKNHLVKNNQNIELVKIT